MPNAGGLTDREAAIDAIIRFVTSLDSGDEELCNSSMTENIVMDLSPFAKAGLNIPVVDGRQAAVNQLMTAVGKALDTTHMATNIRCTVDRDTAELTCTVLAQHFRKGEGLRSECQENCLHGNLYKATIVREGDLWKTKYLMITPAWTQGTHDVMKV